LRFRKKGIEKTLFKENKFSEELENFSNSFISLELQVTVIHDWRLSE